MSRAHRYRDIQQSSFSNLSVTSPMSQLILQPFCCFTYITAHSPTLPSLYVGHSSFSKPSIASPTSQIILQSFFRFSYVTGSSLTSPGEPPMTNTAVLRISFLYGTNAPQNNSMDNDMPKICSKAWFQTRHIEKNSCIR